MDKGGRGEKLRVVIDNRDYYIEITEKEEAAVELEYIKISNYKVDFKKLPSQAMEMELERFSSAS